MCLILLLNIKLILSTAKNVNWAKFLFYIQNIWLIDFNVSICLQTFSTYYFFPVKKVSFYSQAIFLQSNNYLAIKEIFYKKCFTLSRKCYINNEILYSQGNLPRKAFAWTKKSYTNKKVFQKHFLSWSRKSSTNKDFYPVKKFSANKDQKGSTKAKILEPFNTKFYVKIFLTL